MLDNLERFQYIQQFFNVKASKQGGCFFREKQQAACY
jgi:hypothetical protein